MKKLILESTAPFQGLAELVAEQATDLVNLEVQKAGHAAAE